MYYNEKYDVFFRREETKVICSVILIKAVCIFFLQILLEWILPTNLNDFHFNKHFVLYCLVVVNFRGKKAINGYKLSSIFWNYMQNNGFHANNGAMLLQLFCTYRRIHKANCNLISISLRHVFDHQSEWMNELCIMFTNFIMQSINQICLYQAAHSLAHSLR